MLGRISAEGYTKDIMLRAGFLTVGFLVAVGAVHGLAQQQAASVAAQPGLASGAQDAVTRLLPGTRVSVLSTIQGNALSSTNGQLGPASVRLRDARRGRIVETQLTDKAGTFAFKSVDPGTYIVEIMGNDRTVLAASQLVNVNAGQAVSAIVKLPFRIPPFAGLLGNSAPSAAAITAEAAASGLLATTASGAPASAIR